MIRQRHVDNDLGVSAIGESFALACGPTPTPISVNSCIVNGVRFVMHSRDERRTAQNSGICSPGGKDGEMYYGQLQEILEFSYLSFKVVFFRVMWFDTSNKGRKVKHLVLTNNMTQILTKSRAFKDVQYILTTQVKQCFYLEDMARRQPHWKVVEHVNHKKFSDRGVIVVEEDPDVIHFDNSSDLPLSTSLNYLDDATLHIDGQSTKVDAPSYIIDLDEDDGISDDEDAFPHDLADSDDEDLVNVDDDDGVKVMSADVARGHSGDGGGDDCPPIYHIPTGCEGCFSNRGKSALLTERHSSGTQEYPSLIDTFVAHTINGEFLRDENRRGMMRLEATGTYTDDEINRLARRGKQRGHIPSVGRVFPARATAGPMGPTVSLGIVAGEGIPVELSPANIPQRQVARERYPQRHVTRESIEFSPGKVYIVVVQSQQNQ
ncbi:hypothetical protein Tco_0064497 [Tanacetum coccineum]